MFPTYILEWWHDGAWHEIGWRASTPEDRRALLLHGEALKPGSYRIRTVWQPKGEPLHIWWRRDSWNGMILTPEIRAAVQENAERAHFTEAYEGFNDCPAGRHANEKCDCGKAEAEIAWAQIQAYEEGVVG